MSPSRTKVSEEEGRQALHGHLIDKALHARKTYGPSFDEESLAALLADPEVARFPTRLVFEQDDLLAGEFAWARPRGDGPTEGFDLVVHPQFQSQPAALPLIVGYHLPTVNYLDVASREEAELFGAALCGMNVDTYYERLCSLADSLPGAPQPAQHSASLVVVLKPDADVEAVRSSLAQRPDCAVGKPVGSRLPVVLQSDDAVAAEEATRRLAAMPGVGDIEVVAVDLDACEGHVDAQPAPAAIPGGHGCDCKGGQGSCH